MWWYYWYALKKAVGYCIVFVVMTTTGVYTVSEEVERSFFCKFKLNSLFNHLSSFSVRYYRSFHGVSNTRENNAGRTAARLKLTSVLSSKVGDKSISATAGLLHETRRSNSSPCLDDNERTVPKSCPQTEQACPYAITRHRQVTGAVPAMYEVSAKATHSARLSSLRQRSISSSSAAIFNKNNVQLTTGKINGPASASLNSLNSSAKRNKVADLKNKFDLLSEKAKKEEIKFGRRDVSVSSNTTQGVLKSSTVPNCTAPQKPQSSAATKSFKISNVKKAVKCFERSMSDNHNEALNKSTNDLLETKNAISSFSRDNKKYSSTPLPHNASTKPSSASLKISQTSHLHSAVKASMNSCSEAPSKASKTITKSPQKNSSQLHERRLSSPENKPSDGFNKPNVPPIQSKQRKILAKNNISRANLGKAPEPPKTSSVARVPVPQPRKCWTDKIEPMYLNKDNICNASKLVREEQTIKHEALEQKNSSDKSKSLPNSSFLWNYRESVSLSNENLDCQSVESPDDSRTTDSCEYFEDPYVYEENIIEYASTVLPIDDEPIYMEANFLDGTRVNDHTEASGVYACTDVTRLSIENDNKGKCKPE